MDHPPAVRRRPSAIVWILIGALVLRLALIATPGFVGDQQLFARWAAALASTGPATIYDSRSLHVDYPPAYLYVLWGTGVVHAWLAQTLGSGDLGWRILIKLPPIAADLWIVWMVERLALRVASERRALVLAAVAAFAPPLWIDSAVWGQVDSVPLSLALAATIAMLDGRVGAGIPLLVLGVMIKPQSVTLAPAFAFVGFLRARAERSVRGIAIGAVASAAIVYLIPLPFTPDRSPVGVLAFLLDRYVKSVGTAEVTTVGAFNFWAVVTTFYATDETHFGPLPYRVWGVALVLAVIAASSVLLGLSLWRDRGGSAARRVTYVLSYATIGYLALFLFATRIHERYLLPALIFGAPLALDDVPSAVALAWLALAFTANLGVLMLGFYGGHHHPIVAYFSRGMAFGNLVAFVVLFRRQVLLFVRSGGALGA